MAKDRLRKIAILTALSGMLLSGCGKQQKEEVTNETIETTTELQDEITTEEEMVSNQTIAKIYEEYKNKSNKNIDMSNLIIEDFDKPKYLWNKGENYIYDYRINGNDNQEFTYCDPGYHGKMYAVIVKDNENYEPIAALANIDGKIVNVEVTYLYDEKTYEPSENYIYIKNPTKEDFDNIKNGDEYIKSDNKEPLLSTEIKEYNLLYRKNN